jgi:hypothetical protein
MKEQDPKTETAPGHSISMQSETKVPNAGDLTATQATSATDFHSVEELLSKKPVRRPNRTKPVQD